MRAQGRTCAEMTSSTASWCVVVSAFPCGRSLAEQLGKPCLVEVPCRTDRGREQIIATISALPERDRDDEPAAVEPRGDAPGPEVL